MSFATPTAPTADPPLRLLSAFQSVYPRMQPDVMLQSPGREMWIAALPDQSAEYRLIVPDLGTRTIFTLRGANRLRTTFQRPLPRWARYAAGAVVLLSEAEIALSGLSAVIVGNEPPGPRYDHAIGVTVAALWYQLNNRPCSTDSLRELLDRVRREFVER